MICTDIDGTLLDKNRELSTATINSIKGLDKIIETILISSRRMVPFGEWEATILMELTTDLD